MAYSMTACRMAGAGCWWTKRFDRIGNRRVHVHSASGLLYTDIRIPQLDYKDLILLTRSVTRDLRECKAMFVLGVFNVLSHNRDDHARQFSYTMDRDGSWQLAPAYDLTWCAGPGGEHSTSVLGHGKDISRAHLIELGKKAELKEQKVKEIIRSVEIAIGNWQFYAGEYGVNKDSNELITRSLDEIGLQTL
jgi:serine/threonine-protein kinase HipA